MENFLDSVASPSPDEVVGGSKGGTPAAVWSRHDLVPGGFSGYEIYAISLSRELPRGGWIGEAPAMGEMVGGGRQDRAEPVG